MGMDVITTMEIIATMAVCIFSVVAMITGVMFTIIVTEDLKAAKERTLAAGEGEDDETYYDYCIVSRCVGYFISKPLCTRVK
jgi:hypothetical protein